MVNQICFGVGASTKEIATTALLINCRAVDIKNTVTPKPTGEKEKLCHRQY